jgi:ankyrin repeat protein
MSISLNGIVYKVNTDESKLLLSCETADIIIIPSIFEKETIIKVVDYLNNKKYPNDQFYEILKLSMFLIIDDLIAYCAKKLQSKYNFEYLMKNQYDIFHLRTYSNDRIYNACKGGYIEIVKSMIEKGSDDRYYVQHGAYDWNHGLRGACQGGHIEIVNLMIEKGADARGIGLYCACEAGHIDLVNLMIEKGVSIWNFGKGIWNIGLEGACKGGHIEIVNLMIEKGARDWINGLHKACKYGHIEILNLMIEKGANDWNFGLSGACRGGQIEIANLMIKKGAKPTDESNRLFSNYKKYLQNDYPDMNEEIYNVILQNN